MKNPPNSFLLSLTFSYVRCPYTCTYPFKIWTIFLYVYSPEVLASRSTTKKTASLPGILVQHPCPASLSWWEEAGGGNSVKDERLTDKRLIKYE